MYGAHEGMIPGNALAVAPGTPFSGLKFFGNSFLSRFEGAVLDCPILQRLTLIDTPGVLSGEKQRSNRSYQFDQVGGARVGHATPPYDFSFTICFFHALAISNCPRPRTLPHAQVVKWFSDRVDMIVLLFDPFKLDISDELCGVIKILRGNEDKIRVVLNKSDAVEMQQLMRVYGALMWSLGKVFDSPEVVRVYLGSLWQHPPKNPETAELIIAEMDDLMEDLRALPRSSAIRKVKDLTLARTQTLTIIPIITSSPTPHPLTLTPSLTLYAGERAGKAGPAATGPCVRAPRAARRHARHVRSGSKEEEALRAEEYGRDLPNMPCKVQHTAGRLPGHGQVLLDRARARLYRVSACGRFASQAWQAHGRPR